MSAAELQHQDQQASLAEQKRQYDENVARSQPWVTAGTGAINTLSGLVSKPGEGLLTPWDKQFTAPTGLTEQNDPGFQARLKLGQQALENSAASRGGLLAGGTAKDLTNYAQDFASNEYGNVYGRALTEYQQAYNVFQQNQSNTYNRLAGVAGAGQQQVQTLGAQGQQAANNVSNINLTSGQLIGQQLNNAGAATASGYVGAANALTGMGDNLMGLYSLQQILHPSRRGGGRGP